MLEEFHRVLKKGGFLVINITNPMSFWKPASIMLKKLCNFLHLNYGTPISIYFTIPQLENAAKGKFRTIEMLEHRLINFSSAQPIQHTVIFQKT